MIEIIINDMLVFVFFSQLLLFYVIYIFLMHLIAAARKGRHSERKRINIEGKR